MPAAWITNAPRFTAVAIDFENKKNIIVTLPGEPLLELGWMIRNLTLDAGFVATTMLAGYAQDHMGYFATGFFLRILILFVAVVALLFIFKKIANEYVLGGYESQLTLWGIDTADKIAAGVALAMSGV